MIPPKAHLFRFSKPALVIILASSLLALILTVSTLRNLNREQNALENFLLQEGLTLIRSFEAGARTTMRHRMVGAGLLQTLVEETAKEDGLVYIRIVRDDGEIVAEAGDLPESVSPATVQRILRADTPLTHTIVEKHTFEISRVFEPLPPFMPHYGRMMPHPPKWQQEMSKQAPQVIIIGLSTGDFDNMRREDKARAWLLGVMLFLVGSAGLYFLFLYQSNRVIRATLANMRLYTENVIESMPAGLVSLDETGRVVSINSVAEQLLGGTHEKIKDLLLQQNETVSEQDIICHGNDGEDIPVKLSVSPLLNHQGESSGQVLILQDMREIRKIEQQLELSRRLASLGRMAAGIAHEIRNPLSTLRGFAQYFGKEAGAGTDAEKYADLMVSEVDRLNESISTLLQFARAPEPQLSRVDVGKLFAKLNTLLIADCEAAGILLMQQIAPGIILFADSDLLLQVLLNIIQNSIRMTDAGGEIQMKAYIRTDSVILEVRDSGQGMNKEVQEKIFDPFFTTRKDGTGLGLAISHQIVEQHRGRIEVESNVGQGTIMRVILPGGEYE
jgi:two-component system sensor histidine kinase HydH